MSKLPHVSTSPRDPGGDPQPWSRRNRRDQEDPVLVVDGLRVRFPTIHGPVEPVRGVSFEVKSGQRLAIVGESGSGKSLTALAMMRLLRHPGSVSAGKIRLNGTDLLSLDEREMARVRGAELAMVYQNPLSALNPLHRIGNQIVEAIQAHGRTDPGDAVRRAVSLLDEVGIAKAGERFDDYPHQLSGGMRQRVIIAMAMCAHPMVLIADEPTTALDVTTQARIIQLLLQLGLEHNTAVILITHDLGVASSFCEEVRVMYAGRIVEASPSDRFFDRPVHPYSEALIRSVPGRDIDVSRPIPAIVGQPPSPHRLPAGCPFHPRCPYAFVDCERVPPPAVRLDPVGGQFAECHLAEDRFSAHGQGEPRA